MYPHAQKPKKSPSISIFGIQTANPSKICLKKTPVIPPTFQVSQKSVEILQILSFYE